MVVAKTLVACSSQLQLQSIPLTFFLQAEVYSRVEGCGLVAFRGVAEYGVTCDRTAGKGCFWLVPRAITWTLRCD